MKEESVKISAEVCSMCIYGKPLTSDITTCDYILIEGHSRINWDDERRDKKVCNHFVERTEGSDPTSAWRQQQDAEIRKKPRARNYPFDEPVATLDINFLRHPLK